MKYVDTIKIGQKYKVGNLGKYDCCMPTLNSIIQITDIVGTTVKYSIIKGEMFIYKNRTPEFDFQKDCFLQKALTIIDYECEIEYEIC